MAKRLSTPSPASTPDTAAEDRMNPTPSAMCISSPAPGVTRIVDCTRIAPSAAMTARKLAALARTAVPTPHVEGQQQHRGPLQRIDHAEEERGARQAEDQPRLADGLHPAPDQGDELAREKETEVAVTQRRQQRQPAARSPRHSAQRPSRW